MTAADLAQRVGGRLLGPDRAFGAIAPLESAGPQDLAFAVGRVPDACAAGVLLVSEAIPDRTCVLVDDPRLSFALLLADLFPEFHAPGVHPGAHVAHTARLGRGVVVYPGAVVGPFCEIGADTVIFPNVVLYPCTIIGARCRIHAGAVIGADGFAYHPSAQGPVKVPQVGRVRIGDDVEIGANACVDRAFLEETVVGSGTKIDNLVQVGHNARLGRGVIIAAQSGLSGSAVLEDGVILAGQAGIADHVRVGAGAVVGAQAGVSADVPAGTTVLGTPAMPVRLARRVFAAWRHLPELWRKS